MTDSKQALEVVERLREGAGRVARHCMKAPQPGDPALISIPRHERDIDAIMEQAASLLSSLAEENERLRGALARIANTGQSAEPDHWKFRVRARAAARQALTTHPAQPEGEGHEP